MRGVSWLAEQLLAFQEGLCIVELTNEALKNGNRDGPADMLDELYFSILF
jgi:hypothetical protein